MDQRLHQLLAAAVLAGAMALPAAAASTDEIVKATLSKAAIGVAIPVMAYAAPGLFMAVMAVGTGLMVKTIADGMRRPNPYGHARLSTREARPAAEPYRPAFVDASAFPTSTGMYGAFIPTSE